MYRSAANANATRQALHADDHPNAVTATLTLAGLLLSSLVVGTVLVENVFAWPGLGSTIVTSIQTKDYPMAQATVLVYGAGVPHSTLMENASCWPAAKLRERTCEMSVIDCPRTQVTSA